MPVSIISIYHCLDYSEWLFYIFNLPYHIVHALFSVFLYFFLTHKLNIISFILHNDIVYIFVCTLSMIVSRGHWHHLSKHNTCSRLCIVYVLVSSWYGHALNWTTFIRINNYCNKLLSYLPIAYLLFLHVLFLFYCVLEYAGVVAHVWYNYPIFMKQHVGYAIITCFYHLLALIMSP